LKEIIHNNEDILRMLDSLLREPSQFWNNFYSDRQKAVPFFVNSPDENLVNYFEKDLFQNGRVLELGCGPGRNAIYFAKKGCSVDAVDLSIESLKWAKERAIENNVNINFLCLVYIFFQKFSESRNLKMHHPRSIEKNYGISL
jgi:SAM-dependent methyltransferase